MSMKCSNKMFTKSFMKNEKRVYEQFDEKLIHGKLLLLLLTNQVCSLIIKQNKKMHVNRDFYISFLLISRSTFFEEVWIYYRERFADTSNFKNLMS